MHVTKTERINAGHPRVCGENLGLRGVAPEDLRAIPACAGRTSGESCAAPVPDRAIPACAGRTSSRVVRLCSPRGPSPRVRGEPDRVSPAGSGRPGHPRVCGENHDPGFAVVAGQRAIPACAGRTFDCSSTNRLMSGPSPRVRGERQPGNPAAPADGRAIPACAGRTRQRERSGLPGVRAIPACAGRTWR